MLIKEPPKAQKYTKYKANQGKTKPYVMAGREDFSNAFLLKTLFIELHFRVFA